MTLRGIRVAIGVGALFFACGPAAGQLERSSRESLATMLRGIPYGVPASPAFALLPSQTGEIEHLATPADLQANLATWIEDGRLKTGGALDYRLLSRYVGSLEEYRRSSARQVLWRSVFSAGVTEAEEGSTDLILAGGIRLPIIDRGDLRANAAYERRMRSEFQRVLQLCRPLSLTETAEEADERCQPRVRADSAVLALQDSIRSSNWNALRVDVGLAGSARVRDSYLEADSLEAHRAGMWVGVSHGLGRVPAKVTWLFRGSWATTDSIAQERSRYVAGARVGMYPFGRIGRSVGLSLEAAGSRADFSGNQPNDQWLFLTTILEVPLPDIEGIFDEHWVALAYGGERGRTDSEGRRFSVRYGIYRNRLIPD